MALHRQLLPYRMGSGGECGSFCPQLRAGLESYVMVVGRPCQQSLVNDSVALHPRIGSMPKPLLCRDKSVLPSIN